ncbi:MAG: quinone-dependent dihydroorotate dehydrogenase [Calditrichia bacterium]
MYKQVIRRILFQLEPERAHRLTGFLLRIPFLSKLSGICYRFNHPSLRRELFGLQFRNPVGLAAGFDKNAQLYSQLSDLGFGFVEIGTVTPLPQTGNPRPRLFRLPPDQALINRMGFNNDGVEAIRSRLQNRKSGIVIGGNIGKNKSTPNEEAVNDYEICFLRLYEVVDYFVVNVSSPNTPGLRELQDKEPLTKLLNHLMKLNREKPVPKPVLLKIAPDLSEAQLDDIIEIVKSTKISGVIATNTTIERTGLRTPKAEIEKIGPGGLSGKPLAKKSTEVIRYLAGKSGGLFPIIGVGGIHSEQDALEKIEAGASLVQLYTGFVYEGPALIKRINKTLVK